MYYRAAVLVVILAALAVWASFVFVPGSTAGVNTDPSQETACTASAARFVRAQKNQIPPDYDMQVASVAHYSTALKSCFIEMDFLTVFSDATFANNYAIFDEHSGALIADCFVESGKHAGAPFCNDDGHPVGGYVPQMSMSQFDELQALSMSE